MLYRRKSLFLSALLASATLFATACSADTQTLVARISQEDTKLTRLEHALEEMVNAERVKAGLKPLTFKANLADVGRAHSLEMRQLKYFAHESPTPAFRFPCDRYQAAYSAAPPVLAENIYHAWGGDTHEISEADILAAHKAFMHSPTHRDNILFEKFTHVGVGIITDGKGGFWVTQMFSRS